MPSTLVTYKQVSDALIAALKTVTAANGYSTTLPPDHFYKNYDTANMNVTEPGTYPKVFVTQGDVDPRMQVTHRKEVTSEFYVTVVVLQDDRINTVDPQTQVQAIADDIEKMFVNNDSLGGLTNACEVMRLTFDSGVAFPEGVVIMQIQTRYFKQF